MFIVLGNALLFTIVLLAFHVLEEAIKAWFDGRPLATSIAVFGGGTLAGFLTLGAIFFVVPIPFFGVREVARAVGDERFGICSSLGARRRSTLSRTETLIALAAGSASTDCFPLFAVVAGLDPAISSAAGKMTMAGLSANPYSHKYFRACSRLQAFDAPNRRRWPGQARP